MTPRCSATASSSRWPFPFACDMTARQRSSRCEAVLLVSSLRSAAWKQLRTLFVIPGCKRQKGSGPFPNVHVSHRPRSESTRQLSAHFGLKKGLCLCDSQVEQVLETAEKTGEVQAHQTLEKRSRGVGKKSLPFTAPSFQLLSAEKHHIKREKSLNTPEGCETLCRKHYGLIKS